ncbi:tRNA pseudouridine(55) synthase TruB [Pseudanabaena sp. FACHB-2040]|uniref:tRNA pseudouridine(55) synthase TruB n=1 Tax=Pseudanabaena sp. FACHB-2040 TaxID=2692859 RepID=UPI0016891024|nr:tRNA pseudouridine(55) synthase TruB [Pseudanabaena sp. FACHB-2040]
MQGFLNLNKPGGLTSHDCVARVRRLLQTKKVGHGGTLDPAAQGVLPIAVGRATRLLPYLASGKAYRAVIRFGLTTATDDLEGEILHQQPAPDLSLVQVQAALPQFLGQIEQVPPRYSAIQVGGQRLYDLARQGQTVEVPSRQVQVKQIEVLDWQPGEFPELTVAIACGPGTYIRSIARDLGQVLGPGATLAHLLRTHSNGFDLAQSLTLDALKDQAEAGTLTLLPPDDALSYLPALDLAGEIAVRWRQGQKLPVDDQDLQIDALYRVLDETTRFLGIAQIALRDEQPVIVPRMVYEAMG